MRPACRRRSQPNTRRPGSGSGSGSDPAAAHRALAGLALAAFLVLALASHDLIGLDPRLGPLVVAGNGLPIHRLLESSPALDVYDAQDFPPATPSTNAARKAPPPT